MLRVNSPSNSPVSSAEWSPRYLVGDAALALTLILAIVRVIVNFRSVTTLAILADTSLAPPTDIGPTGTAIADGLCILALILALIDRHLRRGRGHVILICLWLIGVIVVAVHVVRGTADPAIAGNWIGTLALGLAALHLADVPWRKRLIAGSLAGLIVALGLFATHHFFIQHPRDVAYYQQHLDEILRQQGWQPGSIQHVKYETRLMQREVTGRIGLANVFGTLIGSLAFVSAGLCVATWRVRRKLSLTLAVVTALGILTLALTFSKGAVVSFIAVIIALALAAALARNRRNWPWRFAVLGLVALAVGAVVTRGIVGPPESAHGERSILFRAMYWDASTQMLADQSVIGIGPGRFQDFYGLVKNPLSPEDVADPHNVFVTYLANLGLGGAAWCAVLIALAWMAGSMSTYTGTSPSPTKNLAWGMAAIIGVCAFGFQYVVQLPELVIETAALWAAGLASFVLIASAVTLHINNHRWLNVGLLAAAAIALVHSQIEMSMTNTMAAPLLMVVLGAAAARPSVTHRSLLGTFVPLSVVTIVCICWFAIPVRVMVHRDQLVHDAKLLMQFKRHDTAAELFDAQPQLWQRDANLTQLAVLVHVKAGHANRALTILDEAMRTTVNNHAAIARNLADLALQLWHVTQLGDYREQAIDTAEQLLELAPYNTLHHLFAAGLADELGEYQLAAQWYRKVLELDDAAYLDPDSQLPGSQLDDVKRQLEELGRLDGGDAESVR